MKYSLVNLMRKHENDVTDEGLRSEISVIEIEDNIKQKSELEEEIEFASGQMEAAKNLTDIKEEAVEILAGENKTEEEYNDISLKLERDINSALALVGGSFMSGKYSPSILSSKIESDILTSTGKRQLEMKVEGVMDVVGKMFKNIFFLIKSIWNKIAGKRKEIDQVTSELGSKAKGLNSFFKTSWGVISNLFGKDSNKRVKKLIGLASALKSTKELEKIYKLSIEFSNAFLDGVKVTDDVAKTREKFVSITKSKGVKLSSFSFAKEIEKDANNCYLYSITTEHVKYLRVKGDAVYGRETKSISSVLENIGSEALANPDKAIKSLSDFVVEISNQAILFNKLCMNELQDLEKMTDDLYDFVLAFGETHQVDDKKVSNLTHLLNIANMMCFDGVVDVIDLAHEALNMVHYVEEAVEDAENRSEK